MKHIAYCVKVLAAGYKRYKNSKWIGVGDRLIVVNASSEKGFVPNASLIYKAK